MFQEQCRTQVQHRQQSRAVRAASMGANKAEHTVCKLRQLGQLQSLSRIINQDVDCNSADHLGAQCCCAAAGQLFPESQTPSQPCCRSTMRMSTQDCTQGSHLDGRFLADSYHHGSAPSGLHPLMHGLHSMVLQRKRSNQAMHLCKATR